MDGPSPTALRRGGRAKETKKKRKRGRRKERREWHVENQKRKCVKMEKSKVKPGLIKDELISNVLLNALAQSILNRVVVMKVLLEGVQESLGGQKLELA